MNNRNELQEPTSVVLTKNPIWATIQTQTHRIQGLVLVRPGKRLIDEINAGEQFIAIRDATITSQEGSDMYRCHFLLVNRNHIVWMIPLEDASHPGDFPGKSQAG